MSGLVESLGQPSSYRDRKYPGGLAALEQKLSLSTTLYIGNLSFYTTEEQIHEVFSRTGEIKRIIMGLDRHKKTPCGFCFVEYYTRVDCLGAMKFINGSRVDERAIRTDIDPGFVAGRQFGRGKAGGQVRDEHRQDYDEGRGGWGARIREDEAREQNSREVYDGTLDIPTGSNNQLYSDYGVQKRNIDSIDDDGSDQLKRSKR